MVTGYEIPTEVIMSLAHAQITANEFFILYNHLRAYKPPYVNMHLREACQRAGQRQLRYLHAVRINPSKPHCVDGMISGPSCFWQYELFFANNTTQLNVIHEIAPPQARDRMARRFTKELMD